MIDGDWWAESWNVEMIPGKGDESPTIHRTRCFNIANQCETGYWPEFQPRFLIAMETFLYADPHWSDPIYYPA